MIAVNKYISSVQSKFRRRLVSLQVFVSDHCWQCPEARTLAKEMAIEFPTLNVLVVELDEPGAIRPENVFSAPTFLLNERVISLGNPSRNALRKQIIAAFDGAKGVPDAKRKIRLSQV